MQLTTPTLGHPKWRRYTNFTRNLPIRLTLLVVAIALAFAQPANAQDTIRTTYNAGILLEQYNEGAAVCSSWILVPGENMWNRGLRAFLYFISLVYAFLGVAIISDIFMSSIEQITASKEVIHTDPHSKQDVKIMVTFWNETVANLTLMALGSSAPEILLSCIETVNRLGKPAGVLGPSTIVGSAAFNLFIIIAICVYTIPATETKKVKEFGVFVITSIASLFAYLWMLVVLLWVSEDEIEIWEALVTLAFFPLLVLLAWGQDRGWNIKFNQKNKVVSAEMTDASGHTPSREAVAQLMRQHRQDHQGSGTADMPTVREITEMAEQAGGLKQRLSRAVYRINAIRMMTAKNTLLPRHRTKESHEEDMQLLAKRKQSTDFNAVSGSKDNNTATGGPSSTTSVDIQPVQPASRRASVVENVHGVLQFSSKSFSVLESEGSITIHIERTSGTEGRVSVEYQTQAGTAKPYEDYKEAQGVVTFESGETLKTIAIVIIDDNQYEEDEFFTVHLSNPTGGAALGKIAKTEVTIIDDDEPGELTFHTKEVSVVETEGEVVLTVDRVNGCDGEVSVLYSTTEGTAAEGREYMSVTNAVLSFSHGESSKTVTIPIIDESAYEKDVNFFVELGETQGGALQGATTKCKVTIVHDSKVSAMVDKVLARINKHNLNIEAQISTHSWAMQFREAMNPTGGMDDDDGDEDEEGSGDGEKSMSGPSHFDYFMHFLTFFWKVIFAMCPPTHYLGGWATFVTSLIFVGLITACVAELASLFGCVVGLDDSITAITFVALGTSLPDTFASKTAAEEEEFADAAVGNVTGSNSVNVFLGLGLPWCIASFYYVARGQKYEVPAGDLAFSVAVYMACACFALLLLFIRRVAVGGELGGPWRGVVAFLLVMCWIVYVVLTILRVTVGIMGGGGGD
eukprot:TRINITY_DN61285_c0_g1_i1.p1 TRINITY_DN61285_c0_g1~~TRINITY_DN61285_c0_g1_i1.p1  ORF type:complete len:912 (-),score=83.41 TRINITY_DN61285_c0_g1_i1:1441-4176(-)